MKTSLIASTLVLLISSLSVAQSNNVDPFLGSYELGGRAKLVWFNANMNSSGFEVGHSLFSGDTAQQPVTDFLETDSVISTDGVSGNFLMSTVSQQERDEAVLGTMESVGDSLVLVKLYIDQYIGGMWSVVPETIDSVKQNASTFGQHMLIRLTSGYFDGGPAKDFAIAYNLPDSSNLITIRVFKLDSLTGQPIQITSVRDDTLSPSLGQQTFFDITAGNFEGTGLDQLLLVKNNALPTAGATHNLSFGFHAYDFDWTTKNLVSKGVYNWNFTVADIYYGNYLKIPLEQLVLSSGDYTGDGRDECVCGFSIYYYGSNALVLPPEMLYYVEPFFLNASTTPATFSFTTIAHSGSDLQAQHIVERATTNLNGIPQSGNSMSLATGNLFGNGKDELVVRTMYNIYTYELNGSLDTLTNVSTNGLYSKLEYGSHRTIAIADIDGDTTFADSGNAGWHPEVVGMDFSFNPGSNTTLGSNNTPHIRAFKYTSTSAPELTEVGAYTGDFSSTVTPDLMWDGGILLGDFTGNAVRLGAPHMEAVTNLVEPAIILNTPPVGFDVIGDSTYNICDAYPYNSSSDLFSSELSTSNTSDSSVGTDTHSSWGVSSTLSAGGSFLGIGAKASFTAKYGQDFDRTRKNESTFSVTQTLTAQWDDWIYATVTSYDIWEYPVYADGALKGHMMAAIAHPSSLQSFSSNAESGPGDRIILDHEPGNLLSYPYSSSDYKSDPDIRPGGLIYTCSGNGIATSGTPSVTIDMTKIQSGSDVTSNSYGFSASASVEGWGVSFETNGSYNHDAVATHTTTITNDIQMSAKFGHLDNSCATAGYTVTPFLYWSVDGALVLDYAVDFPSGNQVTSFWDSHYQVPDLTWNCYYRYMTQMGIPGPIQLKDWTKEIQIFPSTPKESDTVTVLAEIHDYSLKQTPGGVQVRFYLSNSDSGGIPVVGVNGDSVFTTPPVAARGNQMINFKWKVPSGLTTSDSVLYGVIDPGNQITEVKKDNNKAWNSITVIGATPTAVHNPANVVRSFRLLQNYPNPFNPTTVISYQLSAASNVSLRVYDVLGREVATLVNRKERPGTYDVRFNGSRFASGVYFYRIIAKGANGRNFVAVKKLMLLK